MSRQVCSYSINTHSHLLDSLTGHTRGGGAGTHTNNLFGVLNADQSLDASLSLNSLITEDENISQFFQTQIHSIFSDTDLFIDTFRNTSGPLIISLNIQSLSSKFNHLKILIDRLLNVNLPLDMIILQETWGLKYPSQLNLPGFPSLSYTGWAEGWGSRNIRQKWAELQGNERIR
jgi:hypothetical protein